MNAEQARLAAEKFEKKDFNEIISLITTAAESGKYEMWYNNVITDPVRKMLHAEGYIVGKTITDRNETLTKISWSSVQSEDFDKFSSECLH